MKIEIDLANLGFHYDPDGDPIGNRTLEDAIVESAAAMLINHVQRDLRSEIAKAVTAKVNEFVAEQVAAVLSGPIQRTSLWGETKGEATTVKEIAREALEKYLSAPAQGRRDGYSTQQVGNLVELVDQEVKHLMTKDMKDAIAAAKQSVVNDLRDKALRAAAEALMPR